MKQKYMAAIAATLAIGFLAGCQETPENSIVKQKGADKAQEYESASTSVKEMVNAPETYKNKVTYENGVLTIDTDAEIILPDVEMVNTYKVTAEEVNQELIDKVTNAFFDGAKFYHAYSYSQQTKEQYQEEITRLKQYKAEGNLDPYEYGKDENGELYFDIDAVIARDEQELADAPEEIIKEEVKPSFGLEYISGKGEEAEKMVNEYEFYGIAETGHGIYNYTITSGEVSADVKFDIRKQRDDVPDPMEFMDWVEGRYLMDVKLESFSGMPEDEIKSLIDISYEDAEKIAKEHVGKLGYGWEIQDWDYALFHHGEDNVRKENVTDGGYVFFFTRVLDGMPITHTDSYGGGLEDMDSTLTPWGYERCEIIIGDNGFQEVEIFNPYHVEGVQTEHVKLMDFDSIMKIYEQMMEVSNADIGEFETQRTYHVNKIKLCYSRIYDPNVDNRAGVLVPVWDFFGGFDAEIDGHYEQNNGEHSKQSFMTINAIDGTVINRDLGY